MRTCHQRKAPATHTTGAGAEPRLALPILNICQRAVAQGLRLVLTKASGTNGCCLPGSPAAAASATRSSCRRAAPHEHARSPSRLRPPACPRRQPPAGSAPSPTGSSASSTAPGKPHPRRRAPHLVQRTTQSEPCSLTASGRGMSSPGLSWGVLIPVSR